MTSLCNCCLLTHCQSKPTWLFDMFKSKNMYELFIYSEKSHKCKLTSTKVLDFIYNSTLNNA